MCGNCLLWIGQLAEVMVGEGEEGASVAKWADQAIVIPQNPHSTNTLPTFACEEQKSNEHPYIRVVVL